MNSCGENKPTKITAEAVEALQTAIGKDKVSSCEAGSKIKAGVCVRPTTVDEIKEIVRFAKNNNYSISSSNNSAWALDGSRAIEGGILVCMKKFNEIADIDYISMSVKVGVGCKWKDVVEACSKAGFTVGSRPSDLDSSVGSWVVANGMGVGSYKYGSAKDNVLNLQVVTEDATVVETGYDKIGYYMSGYNLTQLFSGSEGTLGIVANVTLKLTPAGFSKSVAYEFADVKEMHEPIQKVVHHASVKPMDISFCSSRKTLLFQLQGAPEFMDLEEQEIDAIIGESATKVSESDAQALWNTRSDSKNKRASAIVPAKEWGCFAPDLSGDFYGSIIDRSTALFFSKEDKSALQEKASKYGGRAISCVEFDWSPKFIEDADAKNADLSRTVTPAIIAELEEIVGAKNVNTNGMDLILYSKDMAPLPKMAGLAFNNLPDVVVRPSKIEEISKIVALAYKHGIPVIPRGNSSWGLGGCQPTNKGIVIDMSSKFDKIMKIDTEGMSVKVGAGCTWKVLLEACMKKGFIVGSMPSSFPSATLGAWLSTNGMGIGSYKYGSAKDNVLSMEVVLCDGTILKTGDDNMGTYKAGYNLNQIFAGSEGTLAVFGTITFRLYPMGEIRPLAYEFEGELKNANEAIQKVVNHPSVKPLHISFSDALHFANQKKAGFHAPDVKNVLLLTLQGDKKFNDLEEKTLDDLVLSTGAKKLPAELGEHEWEERCYEFRARRVGVGEIPAEVIVPTHEWGNFTDECYKGFEVMKMEAGGVIGVVVDRNTALFMPYYFKDDESLLGMTAFAFNFYLGDRAMAYGGRTTGFGIFFAWNLDNIHDEDTVLYMRQLKTLMDPHDVVNPGHVVCGMTRFGVNMSKSLMGLGSGLMQLMKKMLPKNTTFHDNKVRFRYNELEERKAADRVHELGNGAQ